MIGCFVSLSATDTDYGVVSFVGIAVVLTISTFKATWDTSTRITSLAYVRSDVIKDFL